MATIRAILKSAEELANNMGGAAQEFSQAALEILFPIVLRKILLEAGPLKLKSLFKVSALTFAAGTAALPARIIPEFFDRTELYGDDGSGNEVPYVSYIPQYIDFVNIPYSGAGLGFYTIKDGNILAKNIPGESASPTEGVFNFYAHISPEISATPTAELALDDGLTREFIIELARAMRGEPPYLELGEEDKSEKG